MHKEVLILAMPDRATFGGEKGLENCGLCLEANPVALLYTGCCWTQALPIYISQVQVTACRPQTQTLGAFVKAFVANTAGAWTLILDLSYGEREAKFFLKTNRQVTCFL